MCVSSSNKLLISTIVLWYFSLVFILYSFSIFSSLMENYQMIFLGSLPTSTAPPPDHRVSNNGSLLVHGLNNIVDHDHEVKEEGVKFEGHDVYNKFFGGDDHESGPSSRSEKKMKSGKKQGDKVMRRHKYAFQTRSLVDVLDDGYRWRKYGQKTVKNSKFPRSYYKCTYQGCNVKKQIQRLCKDEGIVVTTYEGIHTHPIDRSTENFDQILKRLQTSYAAF